MIRRLLIAALAALCLPVAGAAQLLTTGIGSGGFGGGAVASYDPGGVVFTPEGSAQRLSTGNFNGGTDTKHLIVAFRRKAYFGSPSVANSTSDNWRSSANFGTYNTGATCSLEACPGFMINQDAASWTVDGTGWTLRNTLVNKTTALPTGPGQVLSKTNSGYTGVWQSIVAFYDTNAAAGSRKTAIFVDGSLAATQSDQTDTGAAFDIGWNVTDGVCINACNHSSGIPTGGAVELSDIIVDTANALPAGCPATPANCQSVVNAFYAAGKPVNPGTTTTACDLFRASYSGASAVDWCLRGGASTFLANTGGAANTMSLVNAVASSPRTAAIYDVPYGQNNEPTDRPYLAWVAPQSINNVSTSSTSSCTGVKCESNVTGNYGFSIQTGDRLFVAWYVCQSASTPGGSNPTISAGWSFVPSTTATNPTTDASPARCQWLVATHVATNNYVGANYPWVVGNAFVDPPTITYTSTGTAPLEVGFVMFAYRSTNGVVNIDASDFAAINRSGGINLNFQTPSITTTKATTTLVGVCMNKTNLYSMTAPTGMTFRKSRPYTTGNKPVVTIADQKLTSAGATGAKTFVQQGTGTTNDRAYCGLIALANS